MAAMAGPRRPDPHQGVFETLLVHDRRPVELEAHLARLQASLTELFPDRSAPNLQLGEIPIEEGAMRIDVDAMTDRLAAEISFRGVGEATETLALRSFPFHGGLGRHKWRDRVLLDRAQGELGGLPLLVDTHGELLEAARANVFAVRDGALFTPPLDGRILPGITRKRVIEIAKSREIPVREESLTRESLFLADEVFLTGSVRGIEPGAALDGKPLAGAGPLAATLAAELRRAWLGAPVA
jgi:para-aminobenzoate synthetase / 4-amino-4-deoxychorismate lyase